MYQTLEAEPRESAKPLTFDSFQVAFAPGAPGALPAARAGPAAATAPPATRASAANNLAPRHVPGDPAADLVLLLMMSPPRAAVGRAWPACGGTWPACGGTNGFPHNIDLAESAGQNLTLK